MRPSWGRVWAVCRWGQRRELWGAVGVVADGEKDGAGSAEDRTPEELLRIISAKEAITDR